MLSKLNEIQTGWKYSNQHIKYNTFFSHFFSQSAYNKYIEINE